MLTDHLSCTDEHPAFATTTHLLANFQHEFWILWNPIWVCPTEWKCVSHTGDIWRRRRAPFVVLASRSTHWHDCAAHHRILQRSNLDLAGSQKTLFPGRVDTRFYSAGVHAQCRDTLAHITSVICGRRYSDGDGCLVQHRDGALQGLSCRYLADRPKDPRVFHTNIAYWFRSSHWILAPIHFC